jgi:RNA-binding protein
MITTKQRAHLRAMANTIAPVTQVGKGGITDSLVKTVGEALLARELVKISVLETCELSAREVCEQLCARLDAQPVQVIGRKLVIYRPNPEAPKIVL